MKTFAIIPKRSKPEALALARKVAEWLIERGCAVISEQGTLVTGTAEVPASELAATADFIVVLGGDGTLLHAARLCGRREIPILGINMGTLGFMTEVPSARVFEALERVLAGQIGFERRTKLNVRMIRRGEVILDDDVLNDAVINKNALARIADIEAQVDGRPLTVFRADGVIVSTPTGSSAYSLAAGGPLVHPSVRAVVVTPICPHTLTQRPIVLPEDQVIELLLATDGEMFLTLDGQIGRALEKDDRILIGRSEVTTVLVHAEAATYYAVLRDKLKWGER